MIGYGSIGARHARILGELGCNAAVVSQRAVSFPRIFKDIARALNKLKHERGFSVVVSEQVLSFTMAIADRFLIIEKGEFVYQGTKESVDTQKIHSYLTV